MVGALGATALTGLAGCTTSAPTAQSSSNKNTEVADKEKGLPEAKETDVDRIAADPTQVPDPIDRDEPKHHEITLETVEHTAEIEDGVTFDYMTYEGQVPGPMIRVRRGDTVHLKFTVPDESSDLPHNIDLHAVYGPGGGAAHTTLAPGGEVAEIEFKAMYPGVHIYHCAVPNMDMHISSGMFGAILVEPKEGLPEVDREFYLGQHEIYTNGELGEKGHHSFDVESALDEDPTYVVFNGEPFAFTEKKYGPITAEQGETVRVFLANGGPNLTSSWHPIGNVWSKLYDHGDLVSKPQRYVETSSVPPGSVEAAQMKLPMNGPIKIVDHALTRATRQGALAVVYAEGDGNDDIYDSDP